MKYHCTDAYGVSEPNPSPDRMRAFIDSVFEADDADFPDVSIIHESGWRLTYTSERVMILDNVERESEGWSMKDMSPDEAHSLWLYLAQSEIQKLRRLPWEPLPE